MSPLPNKHMKNLVNKSKKLSSKVSKLIRTNYKKLLKDGSIMTPRKTRSGVALPLVSIHVLPREHNTILQNVIFQEEIAIINAQFQSRLEST